VNPFIELGKSSHSLVKRLTDADVLQHPSRPADLPNWRLTPRPAPGEHFHFEDYGLLPYDVGHEPLVRSIPDPLGRFAEIGHIVRNSFGAEVLVTRLLPIIDVDAAFRPEVDRRVAGTVFTGTWCTEDQVISACRYLSDGEARLYGTHSEPLASQNAYAWSVYFCSELPDDLEVAVFRTYGGWRLVLNQSAPLGRSSDHEMCNLMRFLYADPRYVEIAQQQGTYRARLTAKPWREQSEWSMFGSRQVTELVGTASRGQFRFGARPSLTDPALLVLFNALVDPYVPTCPQQETAALEAA